MTFSAERPPRQTGALLGMFGLSQSENSFSCGDIDDLGRVRQYSLLRFESSAAGAATCDEHIATLHADIDRVADHLEEVSNADINLLLNIAILFTTASGSVEFASVNFKNQLVPLRISVSAYPAIGTLNKSKTVEEIVSQHESPQPSPSTCRPCSDRAIVGA
jgi:hypothetical protein